MTLPRIVDPGRRQRPMTPQRVEAMSRHIREHWGKRPVQEIAEIAGESYNVISRRAADMGMPRLGTCPGGIRGNQVRHALPRVPKGFPAGTLRWARENASADREAAMILAMSGKDVRFLGWR